jgi:hypothetical protein
VDRADGNAGDSMNESGTIHGLPPKLLPGVKTAPVGVDAMTGVPIMGSLANMDCLREDAA